MDFCADCGILIQGDIRKEYCPGCQERRKGFKAKTPCHCELCNSGEVNDFQHKTYGIPDIHHENVSDFNSASDNDTQLIKIHKHFQLEESKQKFSHDNSDIKSVKGCHVSAVKTESNELSTLHCEAVRADSVVESLILERREDLVDEVIREKWEREQRDYQRQLCKRDTDSISRLVGGCRRKPGDTKFYIGGVDISFIKGNAVDACACLSVVQMPDLQLVYQRMEMIQLTHPYIPGFLAFREVPPLVQLYRQLEITAPQFLPDLIMVDGNGILHPRGFGLACQLGVVLDVPTMGVAKTLITAQGIVDDAVHKGKKKSLGAAGGGFDLVSDSGEVLGKCVRVHDHASNPIYISLGHKISLESAVWLALECSKHRIPEPVRRADLDSREYLRLGKKDVQEFIAKT